MKGHVVKWEAIVMSELYIWLVFPGYGSTGNEWSTLTIAEFIFLFWQKQQKAFKELKGKRTIKIQLLEYRCLPS